MNPRYTPSLISWNLTRRCNLRCPHCYLEAGKKAEHELDTKECLLNAAEALFARAGELDPRRQYSTYWFMTPERIALARA